MNRIVNSMPVLALALVLVLAAMVAPVVVGMA
jgi:hypothetical protein